MLDDKREMTRIDASFKESFSAMCSPPISMMYKGRKRSSSKLKKMEMVENASGEALDEDIWAGLLKISKSSEELWKDVYAVSLVARFTLVRTPFPSFHKQPFHPFLRMSFQPQIHSFYSLLSLVVPLTELYITRAHSYSLFLVILLIA